MGGGTRRSVGQEVGARQRHVLPLRVTCCHEERCFDVVVLQIDERDNRREEIGEGTRQLDSQSVRNFFPILIFFSFFSSIRTASSIEAFETFSVDLENSIFDEMCFF